MPPGLLIVSLCCLLSGCRPISSPVLATVCINRPRPSGEDESMGFVWEGPSPSCWSGFPGVLTGLSQEVMIRGKDECLCSVYNCCSSAL